MTLLLALAAIATPIAAATPATPAPAPSPAEAIDPARLDAARSLLETLMPPPRRQMMLDGLLTASTAMTIRAMQSNPALMGMFGKDDRVRPIVERFMNWQRSDFATTLQGALPDMMVAMQRAYARRFTVPEMTELKAFFSTPTGRAFMDKGTTIMADPDVAAWQARLMRTQMAKMPDATRALAAEIMALPPKAAK